VEDGRLHTYELENLWQLAGFKKREKCEKIADIVEQFFNKTPDGKFFTHETILEEWDSATAILEKRKSAGKQGGLAKARNLLEQNPSTPLAISISNSSINIESVLERTRRLGFRDSDSITVEHALFEQVAENKANPEDVFMRLCRIYTWTERLSGLSARRHRVH
jgi:hypothetical protein